MKTLRIDDKFSIVYDETNNNRPLYVERHGSRHQNMDTDMPNWIIAMFYALLLLDEQEDNAMAFNEAVQETKESEMDAWDYWSPGDL